MKLLNLLFIFSIFIVNAQNTELHYKSDAFSKRVLKKLNPTEIIIGKHLDAQAEYPGGFNLLRTNMLRDVYYANIEGKGTIKAVLYFVVEEDGTIKNYIVEGNNSSFNYEIESGFKKNLQKCKPAIYKGENVRSLLMLPFELQID